MEQHYPWFRKKMTTSRGIPKFSKSFFPDVFVQFNFAHGISRIFRLSRSHFRHLTVLELFGNIVCATCKALEFWSNRNRPRFILVFLVAIIFSWRISYNVFFLLSCFHTDNEPKLIFLLLHGQEKLIISWEWRPNLRTAASVQTNDVHLNKLIGC